MKQQPLIVMSVWSAMRLVFVTGLVVALMILAMAGAATSEPDSTGGTPTPSATVQTHG